VTGQARTVRAGAFDPNPIDPTKPDKPTEQLTEPRRRRRERRHAKHSTIHVDRRRDMNIRVRINSARDRARCIYDGHRHPFCFNGYKGWHARPGKEIVSSALVSTANSITLRNGACRQSLAERSDDHHHSGGPNNHDTPILTGSSA
jgi:hypothetical protein